MSDYDMHELSTDGRDVGDDRDESTVIGRHGGKFAGCCGLHVPGVTDRAVVTRTVHDALVQIPRDEIAPGPLCGVEHVEDVGIWETPHTGRAELRREIARLGKRYKRPVVIVHGYQHVGGCPDRTT